MERSRGPGQHPCSPSQKGHLSFPSVSQLLIAALSTVLLSSLLKGLGLWPEPLRTLPSRFRKMFEVSEREGLTCHSEICHK